MFTIIFVMICYSFKEKEKQQIVDTFTAVFKNITVDKLPLFFNIYGFLLFEIYDHKNHLGTVIIHSFGHSV
jgi:surface polysaccharide O-acyltransferase-like enzyme